VSHCTHFITFHINSNLPPKSASEEKKHANEFMRMMSSFLEKQKVEEKEAEKKSKQKLKREDRLIESKREWLAVLDRFDKSVGTAKTRKLIWSGVPPSLRGRVWLAAIGNDLHVTRDLFEIFRKRAADAKAASLAAESASGGAAASLVGREDSVLLIDTDLARTFPLLSFFQPGGPMYDMLRDVLEAYVCYRPDIGYVQGMSFLAALLLLQMDAYECFQCLSNILNRTVMLVCFKMNRAQIEGYMELLKALLRKYVPKVESQFAQQHIMLETFTIDWILTVFSKSLPLEAAARLWDIFLFEGEVFLFRAIVGVLKFLSRDILVNDFELNMKLLTHLPQDVDVEELLKVIASVQLLSGEYETMRAQFLGTESAVLAHRSDS
jgi:hypothetical protein